MTQPCSTPAERTRRAPCPIARELDTYIPLVEQLSFQFLKRVPPSVTLDEIRSAAMCGLFDALRRGRAERGPEFHAYVRTRIRGAIIDELRAQDWLSRSARRRENTKSCDMPTTVVALEDVRAGRVEQVAEASAVSPDRLFEATLDRDKVERAIAELPARERLIVRLYYLEDVSMKEIALQLGVTLSRVSQLRARAVERLRSLIAPDAAAEELLVWERAA